MPGMTIAKKIELRPVLYGPDNEKALFHMWFQRCGSIYALLENEDGLILGYRATGIRFIDNPIAGYHFPQPGGNENG